MGEQGSGDTGGGREAVAGDTGRVSETEPTGRGSGRDARSSRPIGVLLLSGWLLATAVWTLTAVSATPLPRDQASDWAHGTVTLHRVVCASLALGAGLFIATRARIAWWAAATFLSVMVVEGVLTGIAWGLGDGVPLTRLVGKAVLRPLVFGAALVYLNRARVVAWSGVTAPPTSRAIAPVALAALWLFALAVLDAFARTLATSR